MVNTIFSQKEVEYLKSQRLARIATAASSVASPKEEQGEDGQNWVKKAPYYNSLPFARVRNQSQKNIITKNLATITPTCCISQGKKELEQQNMLIGCYSET